MGDKYRAYYIAGMIVAHGEPLKRMVCIIESKDGINWERPKIGLYEYHDFNNNVILRQDYEEPFANFLFLLIQILRVRKMRDLRALVCAITKNRIFPQIASYGAIH